MIAITTAARPAVDPHRGVLLLKVAGPSVPLRDWLLKRPDWLDHETVSALAFAAKTFGASLLALYIAFWAGLDTPRWAFLTVYVVSQPDSGLVLAKSFYRILGTIAGMLYATALVFGLAQYGELFVAATAVWIGLCSFAARGVSNFARYGFQLAGYTVAIVGIPAALEPRAAYPLVVARCTEIALGILCAALFSRLILVRELSPKLVDLVRRLARGADSFATALRDANVDRARVAAERAELAKGYVAVQEMQHSAFFESPEARVLDQPLRKLTQTAVELCAVAEAAASHGSDSFPASQKEPSSATATSQAGVSAAADAATANVLIRVADERDLGVARARLRDSMAAFDRGVELPGRSIRCALWADPLPAALTGIRSALAVGILAAFWFVTSWPNAPTAIVVAAVLCTLLAPMEQPLLPADFTYRNMDLLLGGADRKPTRKLAQLLRPLAAEYDNVFLDCPPSISLVSENVMHAADVLLVPLIPTTLSVRTLDQLTEFVAGFHGKRPEVRAFFSMVDRRKRLHQDITEKLLAERSGVAATRIPALSLIERMSVERSPVAAFAPRSQAARAFRELWTELTADEKPAEEPS